jgi:HEPN domain-containing protein
MDIEDVKEWLMIADDDFDSAKILNESMRKHNEIICYHCAQSIEKYLKAYLIFHDIVPEKTHNLLFLNNICIEKDKKFEEVITECGYMNRFGIDTRYPRRIETKDEDVIFSINAVEKVRTIEPIISLRNKILVIQNNKML